MGLQAPDRSSNVLGLAQGCLQDFLTLIALRPMIWSRPGGGWVVESRVVEIRQLEEHMLKTDGDVEALCLEHLAVEELVVSCTSLVDGAQEAQAGSFENEVL